MFSKQHLFNLDFIAANNFDTIIKDIIKNPTPTDAFPAVITPNVDLTVHLNKNKNLLNSYKNARFILPDGFPIIIFSKLLNKPLKKRLAGSDLFPLIWKASIQHNKKVLLIIPNHSIQKKLESEYPTAMFYIPPFFEASAENIGIESEKIYSLIFEQKPDFVFIGLRFPKQELIVINLHKKIKEASIEMPLFFNLGASFEFYTGSKKRAPQWMQQTGLEWLHRFLSEPKRTFKRYFWDDLYIFILFIKEFFGK